MSIMNMCQCSICQEDRAVLADVVIPKKRKPSNDKNNDKIIFNLKDINTDRFFTYDMNPVLKRYGREPILAFAILEWATRKINVNNNLNKLEKEGHFVMYR